MGILSQSVRASRDTYIRLQSSSGFPGHGRSTSPNNKLIQRGYASKAGHESEILDALARMANQCQRESLQKKLEVLGLRQSDTVAYMTRLATESFEEGKLSEIEPSALQIVQIRKELFDIKHPGTLSVFADMQNLLVERGRLLEAERSGQEVVLWRRGDSRRRRLRYAHFHGKAFNSMV